MKRDEFLLRDMNVSIAGGLVAGITVFTYQYTLDKLWPVWAAFLAAMLLLFIMYYYLSRDIKSAQK